MHARLNRSEFSKEGRKAFRQSNCGESVGEGVTDTDRCVVAIWIDGRPIQKEDGPFLGGSGDETELVLACGIMPLESAIADSLS